MAIKVKRKRRGRGSSAPQSTLTGEAEEVLNRALERIQPRPDRKTWKLMVMGLARQRAIETYMEEFLEEHVEKVGWEWGALWITHIHIAEHGLVDEAMEMYQLLAETFPLNYMTEMSQSRLHRDFTGEYYVARDHINVAQTLWPDGCEAFYQAGILYDLMGVPEYAFAMADRAYGLADQFGDTSYKLKARISFNQAVAMWQAARPYGDIKAYLRRALEDWPEYERAQNFLDSLPEDDEADPRGRSAMQRFTDDIRRNMQQPSYQIIEPPKAEDNDDEEG